MLFVIRFHIRHLPYSVGQTVLEDFNLPSRRWNLICVWKQLVGGCSPSTQSINVWWPGNETKQPIIFYQRSDCCCVSAFFSTFSCYFAYPNLAARSPYSSFRHSHKNSNMWVCFFVLFFLLHLCSFSLTLNSPLTRDLRYFPPACTFSALHSSFLLQSAVKNQERLITVAYINVWLFIPPRSHSSAPGSHISISPALRKYMKVVVFLLGLTILKMLQLHCTVHLLVDF